jgi:glutathione S-transferase
MANTPPFTREGIGMSSFSVHTIPGSPAARAVLATLIEKGEQFRIFPVSPGAQKKQPHLSRQPFGKMPVLEHDNFVLYETQAIKRYLNRILPSPPLVPEDPRAAARMDQIMGITDWYLFCGVSNVIGFHRIVAPRLLANKAYLASEVITLADLIVAPHMDFLSQTPEWAILTRGRSNLLDWMARMKERTSMQATTWEVVTELAKVG